MNRIHIAGLALLLPLLAGCPADRESPPQPELTAEADPGPPPGLVESLNARCSQAFAGRVVVDDPPSEPPLPEELILHVRACDSAITLVSVVAGEDRSRVWLLARRGRGLSLMHVHHGEDGQPLPLSGYGGSVDTLGEDGRSARIRPNPASRAVFEANDRASLVDSEWLLQLDGDTLVWQVSEPGRRQRLEFDLSSPVAAPPPPWMEAPLL